jgi:predicted RNase H-like HicB family nuclease
LKVLQIHTFAPEPYTVKKPIPIVVRSQDGEFLASFLDANVSASGETEQEAFEGTKTLMLDMLGQLQRQPKLGPKLAHRLAVLQEFIEEPRRGGSV